jgi:hypothetical protein
MTSNQQIELHICQHCPCKLDSPQCQLNRLLLQENRHQGYQCRLLRYRKNQGMQQY